MARKRAVTRHQHRMLTCWFVLPDLKKKTLDTALDIAWEVGFEAGKMLSVVPVTENELARLSASPFFQAVQKEGIAV